MSDEELNKMCCDIYEGEDWQPMKNYIINLQNQLQQKENIIKEAREKIENTTINCDGVADDLIDDIYEILEEKQDV